MSPTVVSWLHSDKHSAKQWYMATHYTRPNTVIHKATHYTRPSTVIHMATHYTRPNSDTWLLAHSAKHSDSWLFSALGQTLGHAQRYMATHYSRTSTVIHGWQLHSDTYSDTHTAAHNISPNSDTWLITKHSGKHNDTWLLTERRHVYSLHYTHWYIFGYQLHLPKRVI